MTSIAFKVYLNKTNCDAHTQPQQNQQDKQHKYIPGQYLITETSLARTTKECAAARFLNMLSNIFHFWRKSVATDESKKPLLALESESTLSEPVVMSTQTLTAAAQSTSKPRLYTERTLAKEVQILEVIRIAWTSARMPGVLTDELAETITKVIVTRDEAYQLLVHPYDRAVLEDELRGALCSIDGYDATFYAPLVHQLGNYVVWNWKARGMPCGPTKAVIRKPPPEINISNRVKDVPGRDASVQDLTSLRQRREHARVRWE